MTTMCMHRSRSQKYNHHMWHALWNKNIRNCCSPNLWVTSWGNSLAQPQNLNICSHHSHHSHTAPSYKRNNLHNTV
jgi:hypothetical protein